MAAKKSPRKTTSGKKTATAKAKPKKKAAAKAAGPKKKTAARKKTATQKAAPKKAATRKTAPKRKAPAKAAPERAAKKVAPRARPAKKAREKRGISSMGVNLGHVFALRPRVTTSFPPANLLSARHLLQDDDFESIEEAARAVAEKALELTHRGSATKGAKRGR